MAVWGGITLSGVLGVILGQWFGLTTGLISFNEIPPINLPSIQVVPFALFLLLFFQRINPLNGSMGFMLWFVLQIVITSKNVKTTPPEWMFFGHSVWPLWILGSLLLIWEAPQKTAALRRVEFQERETAPENNRRTPNTSGPFHQTWVTALVDSATGVLVALGIGTFMVYTTLDAFPRYLTVERNIYGLVMGLGILLFLTFLLIKVWNRNRASGMSRSRATVILLIEMTGIGYGMRDWLRVSRGEICRCRSCRNLRLVWHKVCPHCANRSTPTEPRPIKVKSKPSWTAQLWPEHDPEALGFRFIGLIIIVVMIVVSNW
jgi:hypothetical protein